MCCVVLCCVALCCVVFCSVLFCLVLFFFCFLLFCPSVRPSVRPSVCLCVFICFAFAFAFACFFDTRDARKRSREMHTGFASRALTTRAGRKNKLPWLSCHAFHSSTEVGDGCPTSMELFGCCPLPSRDSALEKVRSVSEDTWLRFCLAEPIHCLSELSPPSFVAW